MKKGLLDKTDADRAEELHNLRLQVIAIHRRLTAAVATPIIRKILNNFGAENLTRLKARYYEDCKREFDNLQ